MNDYRYKTPDLCKSLGITRWTLINWEKKGRFTPPRDMGGDRVFTEKQMKEIKVAFSPGGAGQWHFLTASAPRHHQ